MKGRFVPGSLGAARGRGGSAGAGAGGRPGSGSAAALLMGAEEQGEERLPLLSPAARPPLRAAIKRPELFIPRVMCGQAPSRSCSPRFRPASCLLLPSSQTLGQSYTLFLKLFLLSWPVS